MSARIPPSPAPHAPYALRGAYLCYRGDPTERGARSARVYESDGVVAIAGGSIVAAGSAAGVLPTLPPGTPVERLPRGTLLLPGFVDCHVHYPQLPLIASHGRQLLEWLSDYTFPEERRFADARHARAAARVFFDETLSRGTTTSAVFCTVHAESAEAFFAEAVRRGVRAIGGKVLMDRHAPRALRDTARRGYDETKALIARWHGRARLGCAITPRFAPTSSPAQLEAAGALWREHPDCWMQTHLAENRSEVAWVRQLFPAARDYVDVYQRFGLLGRRAVFAHAIHLREREFAALAASGSSIAHCPTSNLFLGSGLFPWARARKPGRLVAVGLATDVGGGTSLSMLHTMAEAYKVAQLGGTTLSPDDAFYLATRGGARALDLEDCIGSIEPGREADLVLLDLRSTPLIGHRMRRVEDIAEALFVQMMLADDRAILRTWVAGRKVHDRASGPEPERGAVRRVRALVD
jgi:guanine deaminase